MDSPFELTPLLDNDWATASVVRRGLHDYRRLHWAYGTFPSWEKVLTDIKTSASSQWGDRFADDPLAFTSETLRKYTAGEIRSPGPRAFTCIAQFLVAERVLSLEELDGTIGILRRTTFLHATLSNQSEESIALSKKLHGEYSVTTRTETGALTLTLRFDLDLTGTLFQVSEGVTLYSFTTPKKTLARYQREGLAFRISNYPALSIFLEGGETEDIVHYIQNSELPQSEKIKFTRHGALEEPTAALPSNKITLSFSRKTSGEKREKAGKREVSA